MNYLAVITLLAQVVLGLVLGSTSGKAANLKGEVIQICEDIAEWPPYHYKKRENGKVTTEVVGYGIDVLKKVLGSKGIKYDIRFKPWKRCLEEVKAGKKSHMILSATYNKERDEAYYLIPWYTTSVQYFYSKKKFPDGLTIKDVKEFDKYNLCGIRGYNYAYAGIEDWKKKIRLTFKNYDNLTKALLQKNNCDIFFEQREIISGFASTGKDYINEYSLGFAPIPGTDVTWFNMLLSRNYEHAFELKKALGEGVAYLFKTGEYKQYLKKNNLESE